MTPHAPVVLDIAGTALSADDRRRLKHPLTGGLILFARHWVDRRQLTELTSEIKSRAPRPADLRRPRRRPRAALPHRRLHPPAADARLGELWMKDALAATDAATACGYVLAAELRACGVDLSFTPVLDLDHGASSVIGDRAFHRDPRVAALLAKSLMHGLLLAGMGNCGKHFPGHGFVKADSHVEVPVDKRPLKAILADDARPYEWLSTSLTSVMPAHVVYPKVDHRPGRLLAALAEGHPARPARLHRRHLQRRPEHGRRAPPRRRRSQLRRGGGAGARRRLRHGAAVQPERRRRRSGRRAARRACSSRPTPAIGRPTPTANGAAWPCCRRRRR